MKTDEEYAKLLEQSLSWENLATKLTHEVADMKTILAFVGRPADDAKLWCVVCGETFHQLDMVTRRCVGCSMRRRVVAPAAAARQYASECYARNGLMRFAYASGVVQELYEAFMSGAALTTVTK